MDGSVEEGADDGSVWGGAARIQKPIEDEKRLNEVNRTQTVNGVAACAEQGSVQQPHDLRFRLAPGASGGSVKALALLTESCVDDVRVCQEP